MLGRSFSGIGVDGGFNGDGGGGRDLRVGKSGDGGWSCGLDGVRLFPQWNKDNDLDSGSTLPARTGEQSVANSRVEALRSTRREESTQMKVPGWVTSGGVSCAKY